MAVLVTGGAGYIGSHTVLELFSNSKTSKNDVVIVDNMCTGHNEAVSNGRLYVGDIRDNELMHKVFAENDIDSIIHFAAHSLVGESVANPLKYYDNNMISTMNLLKHMQKAGVKKIVFSSSAAVYGEPQSLPILETDRMLPTNPYGETKLAIEKLLKWCDSAYGIKYASLRYFNAAGAHVSGSIGEDHNPESHLIPIVLQVALGKRAHIDIYGDDYDTPDGTCVRDYIHVSDLAQAHIAALGKLDKGGQSGIYNLGNGAGFSVKEVIDVCRKVTGKLIPSKIAARRMGDPAVLVASCEKAQSQLGLQMRYGALEKIVETAWNWHHGRPDGFRR